MSKIWERQNQETTDLRDGGGDVEGADLGALAGGERHLGRLHADRLDAVVPVLRVEREWVGWLELQVQTEVKLAPCWVHTLTKIPIYMWCTYGSYALCVNFCTIYRHWLYAASVGGLHLFMTNRARPAPN